MTLRPGDFRDGPWPGPEQERHEGKRRRFAPPVLVFGSAAALPKPRTISAAAHPTAELAASFELPRALHLQSVRAVAPNASSFLLRLQHLYATGEDAERSVALEVELPELVAAVAPASKTASVRQTTLDGTNDVAAMARRRRFPTAAEDLDEAVAVAAAGGGLGGGQTVVRRQCWQKRA